MSMIDWAEREVEIACDRERANADNDEWDYSVACYESALRAFKCLCGDGHSGMSIGITKQILNRLIDGKPLTPIEDTEDMWYQCNHGYSDKKITYQCNRMSSLFKYVYPDGRVEYTDVDRVLCYGKTNPVVCYRSSLVRRLIDNMLPITMPYCPDGPIKVACEDFLVDRRNGDFDTVAIFYADRPNGEHIEINRYFKCDDWLDNDWVEIDCLDYNVRADACERRIENERKNQN